MTEHRCVPDVCRGRPIPCGEACVCTTIAWFEGPNPWRAGKARDCPFCAHRRNPPTAKRSGES